jgi:hypothetical protein
MVVWWSVAFDVAIDVSLVEVLWSIGAKFLAEGKGNSTYFGFREVCSHEMVDNACDLATSAGIENGSALQGDAFSAKHGRELWSVGKEPAQTTRLENCVAVGKVIPLGSRAALWSGMSVPLGEGCFIVMGDGIDGNRWSLGCWGNHLYRIWGVILTVVGTGNPHELDGIAS